MTDDKGAGEGPYRGGQYIGFPDGTSGLDECWNLDDRTAALANMAFAAGRKAEREKLCESIISNIGRSMEALASIEHDRWARWHIYAKNNWTPENIIRWDRQAETKYQDLTEEEKEKDRQEVRNYLWVIKNEIISMDVEK
jgi:hypothetical protein